MSPSHKHIYDLSTSIRYKCFLRPDFTKSYPPGPPGVLSPHNPNLE